MTARILRATCLTTLLATMAACDETPTQAVVEDGPRYSVYGSENPVGAIVINLGQASEPYSSRCQISGRITYDVTVVATANGGAVFHCRYETFPAAPDFGPGAAVFRGWRCTLNSKVGYQGETYNTVFSLAENNRATAQCTFEGQFSQGDRS